VGSNVANLTLVLGAAALVTPIVVRSPVLKREAPLSLGLVLLFAVLVQSGLSRIDAVVLGSCCSWRSGSSSSPRAAPTRP
jgi:cation:H+ antiporter